MLLEKMALIDLMDEGLPETFNLFKRKKERKKERKALSAKHSKMKYTCTSTFTVSWAATWRTQPHPRSGPFNSSVAVR